MPKYSVHIAGNGSTGYARDYVVCNTLAEVAEELRRFAVGVNAVNESGWDYGAVADVYPFDERDSACMTFGDYPRLRFITGPRGGIRRLTV